MARSDDEDMNLLPSDDSYDGPDMPYRRRAPAQLLGAVAVVRRGHEDNFEDEEDWDPTVPLPSINDQEPLFQTPAWTYLDAAATPYKNMSTRRKLVCFAVVALILIVSITVIVVTVTGKEGYTAPTQISLENPCDFNNTAQPDPILQCACNGVISVLSDEVISKYELLKKTFAPDIIPGGLSHFVDSCEPQNAALLWLATDTEERSPESMRNRYLLGLLFAYWNGIEWKKNAGWLTTESECTWTGINCTDNLVTQIDLLSNDLDGEMATELGLFKDLRK